VTAEKRWKVYVTRMVPGPGISILKEKADVEVSPGDLPVPREVLMEKVRDIDGLLCLLTDKIDKEVIAAAKKLSVIANYAVGHDNVDIEAATKRGIAVTNTPEVLTETTADLAWSLLMAVARRIVEADRFTRDGRYRAWSPTLLLGKDVHGKILGIVGAGRIGSAVAKRAAGFGMRILYYDTERKPEIEKETGARYSAFEDLLGESDFISVHLPLSGATRHMIGERELKMMKRSAILINTSRGPVVKESDLVRALADGTIAGAGLDVYEAEPALAKGLASLENAVLAPHIGSGSEATRSEMARLAAASIVDRLEGRVPENLVNREILG